MNTQSASNTNTFLNPTSTRMNWHDVLPTKSALRRQSHDPMLLAQAAKLSFERPFMAMSHPQRKAVVKFRLWRRRLEARLARGGWDAVLRDDTVLQEGFDYVNEIFFLNSIPAKIRWSATSTGMNEAMAAGCNYWGTDIIINREHHDLIGLSGDPEGASHYICGLILHEACHAFLGAYQCLLECPKCIYPHVFLRTKGYGGHGWAWVELAGAVKNRSDLVGVRLRRDMGIANSIELHCQWQGERPTPEMVEDVFGQWTKPQKHLKYASSKLATFSRKLMMRLKLTVEKGSMLMEEQAAVVKGA